MEKVLLLKIMLILGFSLSNGEQDLALLVSLHLSLHGNIHN